MSAKVSKEEKKRRARERCRRWTTTHKEEKRAYLAEYRRTHNKELRAYWDKYYQEHRDELLAYQKAYRLKKLQNPTWVAKDRAKQRAFVETNAERCKEYARKYRRTLKGKATTARRGAKRRAALDATECTLTADEWQSILERNKHKCYWCGKKSKKLTMDHVIPLSKGGRHVKENIVPACRSCNSKKADKILTLL